MRALRPTTVALLATLASAGLAGTAQADGEREDRRSRTVRVVEAARPATVAIHTSHLAYPTFWGVELPELPPVNRRGLGSGTIFHPAGYVITNAHVIARATTINVDVTAPDGTVRKQSGRIVAVDVPNDLAILRLLPAPDAADVGGPYPYLPLVRADDLMLGETVIAVGHPFGIGFTVTTGVVGGLNRRLDAGEGGGPSFEDFIQIDAAVNPGNSGGPLLDVTGRWIGVTTAIANRSRLGAEGIGFAIPTSRVRALVAKAFRRRVLTGEWLGFEEEERAADGATVVKWVYPKGPASGSGLKPGDVLVSVDGQATPTLYDLRMRVAAAAQGSVLTLGVVRDGRPLPAPITVPLLPVPTDTLSERHLGILVTDVDEALNREVRLPFDAGVLVREVREDGPGARIGLKPGDLVVALGTYRIRNADDLLVFLQYVQPGDLVKVRVKRLVSRRPDGRTDWNEREGALVAM